MPNLINFDSRIQHIEKIFALLKNALQQNDRITAVGAAEGVWEALNNFHDEFSVNAPENFELNGMRQRLLNTVIRPLKDGRLTDLSAIFTVLNAFYDDFYEWTALANKSQNFRKSYFKGLVFGVKRLLRDDLERKMRAVIHGEDVHFRVNSEIDKGGKSGKIIIDVEIDSTPNLQMDSEAFARIVEDMREQAKKELNRLGLNVNMSNTDIRGKLIGDTEATVIIPFETRAY